jgi:peptidoglycan/xylan/chitin deacetylase (PgdA/CDA1 family)
VRNRFQWPGGFKCAVSLTFDDGLPSQLKVAVPLLDRYGVKATFYVNPSGGDWAERLKPWRKVSEEGHEIGNHTLSHPCSCNYPFSAGRCLEEMTLEEIEADILEAQRRLEAVAAGGRVETFAYPCYESYVGRGAGRRSYVPVVARHFLAARGGGDPPWSNDPLLCDLHYLWSWPADKLTLAEMVGLVEMAAAQGRWAIFTFHGVGGDYLQVEEGDLRALLEYLEGRSDAWVAPVAQVAAYVAGRRRELGVEGARRAAAGSE